MATEKELKERWLTDDGKRLLKKVIKAGKKKEEDWAAILRGFPHVEEVKNRRDLRRADLRGANLTGAHLLGTDLSGADLLAANLSGANLTGAHLLGTDLSGADLSQASLLAANLSGANLVDVGLSGAKLWGSSLVGAFIVRADLRGADLTRANLKDAQIAEAQINDRTYLLGADIRQANFSSDPVLKRDMEDLQWLQGWKAKGGLRRTIVHFLWSISCDCGRSFLLWAAWSVIFVMCFCQIYSSNKDSFTIGSEKTLADAHWFMPLYYSIVTFTTLGFGDVTPKPDEWQMQGVVALQVILGYIMLGGLISIFATKLARRS